MRTVRSFDPCLPCGVHMYLGKGKVLKKMHSPGDARPSPTSADRPASRAARRGAAATSGPSATASRRCSTSCRPRSTRAACERVEELVRLVTELYGGGLARVVELAGEALPTSAASSALADDDLVASLLVVHGLHPDGLPQRVERRARRRCGRSSAATAATSSCSTSTRTSGAVHLRLLGSCDGCPSSAVTLQPRSSGRSTRPRPRSSIIDVEEPTARAGPHRRCSLDRAKPRWRTTRRPGAGPCGDRPRSRCCSAIRDGAAAASARGRASAARCAASRSPTSTTTSSTSRPRPDVRLPRLLPAVHVRTAPAAAATGRCPIATSPSRDFAAADGAVGRAADPGQRRVLLPQLDARAGRRVLPEPGGRHRVAAAARRLGRRSSPPTPSLATLGPTSRRSSCARRRPVDGRRPPECFLVPIDACYELVGELRRLWRGFDGGSEAHDALDAFFDRVRAARRVRAAADERRSTFDVVDARAEPYAAVPTLCSGCAITRADGASRCTPSRCGARSDRAAAPALRRRRGGPAARAVRRARRSGATRCGRSCGPHVGTTVAGFTGSTEVDLPVPCTYDFEVAAAKYLHALDDGEIPLRAAVLRHGVLPRRERRLRAAPVAWHVEASFRLPVAGVARRDGPVLPEQRLDPAAPRHARRARSGTRPSGRCPTWDDASSGCSRKPARTLMTRAMPPVDRVRGGPSRRRRRAVRGLRALPVPRLGGEEPGALAVRRARPAGRSPSRRLRAVDACGPSASSIRGAGADAARPAPLPPGAGPHGRGAVDGELRAGRPARGRRRRVSAVGRGRRARARRRRRSRCCRCRPSRRERPLDLAGDATRSSEVARRRGTVVGRAIHRREPVDGRGRASRSRWADGPRPAATRDGRRSRTPPTGRRPRRRPRRGHAPVARRRAHAAGRRRRRVRLAARPARVRRGGGRRVPQRRHLPGARRRRRRRPT